MTKLFYRFNKNKFTNVQIQEQTDSMSLHSLLDPQTDMKKLPAALFIFRNQLVTISIKYNSNLMI